MTYLMVTTPTSEPRPSKFDNTLATFLVPLALTLSWSQIAILVSPNHVAVLVDALQILQNVTAS